MMDAAPTIVRMDAVAKRFGPVTAVAAVSLDIRANEFLALLGASGCGKTTLLRLIAGLETPDSGHIIIDGRDMTRTPAHARPVNMMFQSYALFPHMSVAGNVAFGLKQEGIGGAELAARVKEALAIVELDTLGARKPHQLSGGQKQRVALARCLAKRPRVLLLDEPLAALDKHLRERTQLELMALQQRLGIAFVVVTHDQDEAMTMADRVAVMDAGRILQVAPPRQLYERPGSRAVAGFFGDINLWEGKVTGDGCSVRCPALGRDLVVAEALPPPHTPVVIALRPEQIALTRAHAGDGIAGVVGDIVYRGTMSIYFVGIGDAGVVRVVRQNAGPEPAPQRGDRLFLSWPASAVRVLHD